VPLEGQGQAKESSKQQQYYLLAATSILYQLIEDIKKVNDGLPLIVARG
jgi:hypothetical protein